MPELPEVETIRRQLAKKIIGKKLKGKKIASVRRRGKILIIDLVNGSALVFHPKMTGQLLVNGKPSKHTRRIFRFDDGGLLLFNDTRKFGWWKEVRDSSKIEKELGPEPFEINLKTFKSILSKRPNAKIKTLLMDQRFVAGIGNIYSDEILYAAKIHPQRQVSTLQSREVELIFKNIKKILRSAISHKGSSFRNYRDAFGKEGDYVRYHKVYQKEGQKCGRCGTTIKRVKMGGRSAHFCPNCQKIW